MNLQGWSLGLTRDRVIVGLERPTQGNVAVWSVFSNCRSEHAFTRKTN